ncbi:MAG: hydratase [Steroidobacteraceae bacterium]
MTERGRGAVERSPAAFVVGPSSLQWQGDALDIRLDETCMPLPRRVRGRVRLYPGTCPDFIATLDESGSHRWSPIAPRARVEVELDEPRASWRGEGYFDTNAGTAPLESSFRSWQWSRTHEDGGTRVYYDVARHGGSRLGLALRIDAAGQVSECPRPAAVDLPGTGWRIERRLRSALAADTLRRSLQTLEDTPFYARSLLRGPDGAVTVHESLSLDRFRSPWVQWMLPFRMPRRRSGRASGRVPRDA